MARVPVTVITGFLGAGKTTLVRHLLEHPDGRRLALVVNEFGEVGIDRELLLGCGLAGCREEDLVELANGCICCTVADDFLPTMRRLLDRATPPDHILVETSGLALPKPLVKAFAWPEVRTRATVDGVVAVIDAEATARGLFAPDPAAVERARAADPALDHDSPLEELFAEQIACADLVVLNKTDRVDAAGLERAEAAIAPHLRPGVRVARARFGRLDPAILLGVAAAAEEDLESRPSHTDRAAEHDHDEFTSLVLEAGEIADPTALVEALRALARELPIYRVKGFVAVAGRPMRLVVQAVGDRVEVYFDRPWRAGEERRSRLVVIGSAGLAADPCRTRLGIPFSGVD
ncbi:Putative metal chaperone YciC [bacterium HR40]|nr:Putative metal chaperone YciC [bacterium HR40]